MGGKGDVSRNVDWIIGLASPREVENGSCPLFPPTPSRLIKSRNFTGRKTAPVISEIGDSLRFPLLRPPDPSAKIKETRRPSQATSLPFALFNRNSEERGMAKRIEREREKKKNERTGEKGVVDIVCRGVVPAEIVRLTSRSLRENGVTTLPVTVVQFSSRTLLYTARNEASDSENLLRILLQFVTYYP